MLAFCLRQAQNMFALFLTSITYVCTSSCAQTFIPELKNPFTNFYQGYGDPQFSYFVLDLALLLHVPNWTGLTRKAWKQYLINADKFRAGAYQREQKSFLGRFSHVFSHFFEILGDPHCCIQESPNVLSDVRRFLFLSILYWKNGTCCQ